jgi:hypothetical protein
LAASGIEARFSSGGENMDDRKLLALAKKNAAMALKKPAVTPKYDSTLPPDPEDVERLKKFHNEMKKRDF